jgi:hypothetical protein
LALPSLAPGHASRPARVPQGFLGTVLGSPVFPDETSGGQVLPSQLDLMVASGVEGVRVVFDWAAAQPYAKASEVPPDQQGRFQNNGVDNVPTDFTALDHLVGEAAQRRLPVLPVVINAPGWDGDWDKGGTLAIPHSPGPYAAFCKALVLRYGPHGTFWKTFAGHPQPVTAWQIWNEPNVPAFWPPQPFAKRYVALLHAAHSAIRAADPHAKIVLAGLANYSWAALRSIYRIHGARRLFDVVGLHPYTKTPQGVVTILRLGRQVMRAAGDGAKPMIADEISWPSSQGKTVHTTGYDFATTESGQARNVAKVLPLLAANRAKLGLVAVYYYTWASVEIPNGLAFTYAGLLKYEHSGFVRKPSFFAFRHAALGLERCHQKATVANVCRSSY